MAKKKARDISVPVTFLSHAGEAIPLDAGSIDTVVMTWTLCSIPDPVRALREAGLVRPERRGPFIYYCLHDPEFLNIVANLNAWLTNGHREGGRKARSKAVEFVWLPGCVPKRISRGNGKAATSR